MSVPIRTTEIQSKEVFIDVNDLLIYLMSREQGVNSQEAKSEIRKIIGCLTELRSVGHKRA